MYILHNLALQSIWLISIKVQIIALEWEIMGKNFKKKINKRTIRQLVK